MENIINFLNVNNGALMVIITAVYVVATIQICRANIKSAKASNAQVAAAKEQTDAVKAQLDESKREYEETKRLQMMPYFEIICGSARKRGISLLPGIPAKAGRSGRE